MKVLLAAFFCLFLGFNIFGQGAETMKTADVNVESIALMRDDGKGNAGVETEGFKTTDVPIHFRVTLDSLKSSTIKMNLVAAAVERLKAEYKIITLSFKTNGNQKIVYFESSPNKAWLPGKYRVDIFIDDKLSKNKEFQIENSTSPPAKVTTPVPPKPKPRLKPKRKTE